MTRAEVALALATNELYGAYLRGREQALPKALQPALDAAREVAESGEAFAGEVVRSGLALRTWGHVGSPWVREVFSCTPIDAVALESAAPEPLAVLARAVLSEAPVLVNQPLPDLLVRGRLPPQQRWLDNFVAIPCRSPRGVVGVVAFAGRDGGYDTALVERLQGFADALGTIFHALHRDREQRRTEKELTEARERAEALAQRKSEFLSVMSHEIRSPLNGVLGLAHLLVTEDPAEHQRENLEALQFAAGNLLHLVNDVLDFSKLESGKFELHEGPVDVRRVLDGIVRSHRTIARDRGIEIVLESDGLPPLCTTDEVRLTQVLTNLTHNAIKFTSRGSVTVGASVVEGHLLFAVEDTGIGIPEDKQDTLFEAFTRVAGESEKTYGSTGLGLAICRQLVRSLGGELRLHSRTGEGSRFWFSIPMRPCPVAPLAAVPTAEAVASVRVLLIDDVPLNLRVASRIMESFGAVVETADSGYEALNALAQRRFDVILLDLYMPDMDGFETFKHIRARGYTTPVYALSADTMRETTARITREGMDGLLPKPTPPLVLRELLLRHAQTGPSVGSSNTPR